MRLRRFGSLPPAIVATAVEIVVAVAALSWLAARTRLISATSATASSASASSDA